MVRAEAEQDGIVQCAMAMDRKSWESVGNAEAVVVWNVYIAA